ncbi:MAG: DUF11 domain-containing protein [Deltaproteobacteria bacterium]|nr:DUF11 domain-containing protein [Deltaproteobacteria bacterium]
MPKPSPVLLWKRKPSAQYCLSFSVLLAGTVLLLSLLPNVAIGQATPVTNCTPNVVNYDLVYVRAPRYGDNDNTVWPDTVRPLVPDPGADLRLLHPNCTEELLFPRSEHQSLVDAPLGNGSVSDPNVSFDGQWVVFTYYHDQTDTNLQRCADGYGAACLSYKGADLYRLNLVTRQVVRLTFQEFTPNTGNGANFDCTQPYTNCPNVGVFNTGPAFVAQNDPAQPAIVFTSTRNNFLPPKAFNSAERVLQLFVMDWDGANVQQIGYLNNTQALHPFQLMDGRLMFTSWENQGARDTRQFNLWFIGPDGTQWASGSGFGENAIGHHFMTQMGNGDIVVVRYYNLNNNGFGDLVRYPLDPPGADFGTVTDPEAAIPFQRPDQLDLTRWSDTEWSLAEDFPAPCGIGAPVYPPVSCSGGNGSRVGKVTHPAAAPNGTVLLVYTRGAANHNGIYVGAGFASPYYDGGLYLMPSTIATSGSTNPADLVKILNHPSYNEQWPRPVVPYATLFPGHAQPVVWPQLANVGNAEHDLPANTPFGLVGSSSLIWRDTNPRPGPYDPDPDPFNTSHEFLWAWVHQGADAGLYTNNDIYAIRLLALLPSTDRTYPNGGPGFANIGSERMRILGEIPVRHEGVIDATGNTDTSFLARIPADTPFTFQTLDRNGMVLNMAQTWHQLRPGEARYNCGGCHAHSKTPLNFDTTVAGQPGFTPTDLTLQTPLLRLTQLNGTPTTTTQTTPSVTVEYFRDVQPILQQRCSSCHLNDTSDGKLNLHADATTVSGWPGTYYRLVLDSNAAFGLGVPTGSPQNYFIDPQLTRYLRSLQSRESLLIWKVFGARLDGRTNTTRTGDLDYNPASDTIHPHLDTLRGLTWDEKLTLARWVDLGAPINLDNFWGWFEDDLRPTLWVAPTIAQAHSGPVNKVTVGAYDLESGLAANTLTVTFNMAIDGRPAGTNFAAGLNPANGGVLDIPLPTSVDLVTSQAVLTVQIRDNAGQITEVTRAFAGESSAPPPPPPSTLVDLAVTAVDSPDPVAVGGKLAYTFSVSNKGPDTATGVKLVDTLPAGVTFVSASASQGSCNGTATVTCNLGSLANGANISVTVVVTSTVTGTLTNTVSVTSTENDSSNTNNTATATTIVKPAFRLTVSIKGSGTATGNPAGISCPGDCIEYYASGTSITLTASPASGQRFTGWSGACTGTSSCVVKLTKNRTVKANFKRQ